MVQPPFPHLLTQKIDKLSKHFQKFKKDKHSSMGLLKAVNRTLLTFAENGIIHVVEGYGDPKRFDPVISPHHHFRCLSCNKIIDFSEKSYDKLNVPAEIQNNYVVLYKRVIIEGLCD
ncbi:TPA: hypothetical protein EYP27_00395, partial [Candidatus Bathyarchaeota archaeon]|nr:hypothetical protein [Candidatus Bathyarchaeota archaeon]